MFNGLNVRSRSEIVANVVLGHNYDLMNAETENYRPTKWNESANKLGQVHSICYHHVHGKEKWYWIPKFHVLFADNETNIKDWENTRVQIRNKQVRFMSS